MNNYQTNYNKRILDLAVKYYGTTDLRRLTPHQLDKLTTWVTWSQDSGKSSQRKAERALHNKRSGGKRYLNSADKTQAIIEKRHRH